MCQYRLDYQTFSTMVSATGACTDPDDGLSFSTPAAVEPPTICGTNTGLHSRAGFYSFANWMYFT